MTVPLLLAGCGKMGSALLRCASGHFSGYAVDPAEPPAFAKTLPGFHWAASPDTIDPAFRPALIVIAVKPQVMAGVLPAYARFSDSVFLSIAAGQTLARLGALLGGQPALVRAMPNLPAGIGQGMTVAIAGQGVSAAQKALCDRFLKAVGEVAWVEDEKWLDAVTALSGSGPAYVFALAEAMARAGESLGLPPALAEKLARQTLIGSGALLAQSPESAGALCRAVTSPGGTTEAALRHLRAPGGLFDAILRAMQAAAARAGELAE